MNFPKFFPRLQKFLTENPCYTSEKKSIELNFYIELKLVSTKESQISERLYRTKTNCLKCLQSNSILLIIFQIKKARQLLDEPFSH